MMKTTLPSFLIPSLCIFVLLGCAGGDSSQMVSGDKAMPAGETQSFSHKMPKDTMDWTSLGTRPLKPADKETDLEWPGERMGLIGPIVTSHGQGSRRFVLVYDSAGVLVGGLTYKEYQKEPRRFDALIEKAQARSEYQNEMAMRYLYKKRLTAERAAAGAELGGGRHEK